MGPRQKKILNEYVGLVRSFSRVHWFIVPILTLFTLHSDGFFPTLITKKAFTCLNTSNTFCQTHFLNFVGCIH